MTRQRLRETLEVLGLTESAPPTATQWRAFLDTLGEHEDDVADLRREAQTWASFLQTSPNVILTIRRDYTISSLNRTASGLPISTYVGQSLIELVSPAYRDRVLKEVESVLETGEPAIFVVDRELEDRLAWFEVQVHPLEVEDSADCLALVTREITDRKLAEREAERANRAKSQFLSNMSHELRTPLNAILGFGRVLEQGAYGELNPRQRQYLADIIHSGEHMLELVNSLLDLRRLEEVDGFLTPIEQPLDALVERAVSMVAPLIEGKEHRLTLDVSPDLPPVMADARGVVRVVVNLLSNAVKYTPDGGDIAIRASSRGEWVQVDVVDNGIGVSTEHQARIFDYFEQVHGAGIPSALGSGIGLALSRELVERMNGSIGVQSEEGVGSCFFFTLPAITHRPIRRT